MATNQNLIKAGPWLYIIIVANSVQNDPNRIGCSKVDVARAKPDRKTGVTLIGTPDRALIISWRNIRLESVSASANIITIIAKYRSTRMNVATAPGPKTKARAATYA